MTEPSLPEESIFAQAQEFSSAAERAVFLDRACGENQALRAEIEALLRADAKAGDMLDLSDQPVATVDEPAISERPGTIIGPYKLLEQIGEGGFGVVFMAEQSHPVRRKVALKILKPGMDTRQVVARFEAERQALAIMDHPNIAKVFDGGMTGGRSQGSGVGDRGVAEEAMRRRGDEVRRADEGFSDSSFASPLPSSLSPRPYFVMELVKGLPINDYCDQNHLTPRQRLELFIPVCQAVQHAHQKGIIHRDLKPSNVLVAVHDTAPVVKVIDFGVAKALGQELTDKTLFTGFGQMIGTPLYMSPEQAGLSGLDIDTRSDIYSLGVLLYELLTGTTPFTKERFKQAAYDEIRRIIREEDPPRPSTRLSDSKDSLPSISAQRQMEPAKLTKLVRGELDWIVMKALEKDRNRRYETANAFALDLQRYLADEPVQACPPSAGYRFRKFARRNKAALVTGTLVGMAMALSVIVLAISNVRINREKEQKQAALIRAIREKGRADENLSSARRAVKEYLLKTSDSPLLKCADFQHLRKELLESALPFYEGFVRQAREDPTLEAERGRAYQDLSILRRELGDRTRALDILAEAENIFRLLTRSIPDEPNYAHELAWTTMSRGALLSELARFDEAEQAYRQALAILEPLATANPRPEYRATLAQAINNLGDHFRELGRNDDAEATLRRAITLREQLLHEQPDAWEIRGRLAQSWLNLGGVFHAERRGDDARQAYEKALELLTPDIVRKLPAGSALTVSYQQLRGRALNNLGIIHRDAGRHGDAERAYRDALAIKESLAETFPSVPQYRHELARSFNNLGILLAKLTRREDARAAYKEALRIYERLVADSGAIPLYAVELAGTYANLGWLAGDDGQLEASLSLLTKSVEILEAAHLNDSREVKVRESLVDSHWTRAVTLSRLGRFALAAEDWSRALELDDGRDSNTLRYKRASTLVNLKDHAGAVADAQAIAESSTATGEDLFNAACVYAVSARIASDDASLAESYAARAVVELRRAAGKGFKNLVHIRTYSDLDALQVRDDFRKLLQELEERP